MSKTASRSRLSRLLPRFLRGDKGNKTEGSIDSKTPLCFIHFLDDSHHQIQIKVTFCLPLHLHLPDCDSLPPPPSGLVKYTYICIIIVLYKLNNSLILRLFFFRGTGKEASCRRKCASYSACTKKTTLDCALSIQQDRP